MFSRFERLLIAVMVALLLAAITFLVAWAQEGGPSSPAPQAPSCVACHTEFVMEWQSGPHGKAVSDPVFVNEWTRQGRPDACLVCHVTGFDPTTASWKENGVSCEACHGPMSPDHPREPMQIDRSPALCGRCHSDTRFGWQQWQGSTHYQRGMNCITCHDPHSASLKIVKSLDNSNPYNDASQLCITCHTEISMDFPYSIHYQQGVSCVECHTTRVENIPREAHTVPDHSFKASLNNCSRCHADQMHASASPPEAAPSASADTTTPRLKEAGLTPEPYPVSPLGFATLAGLIGLAAGMILAPWLEKWYRRATTHNREGEP